MKNEVKIQTLEKVINLDKSHEKKSEALMMGWKETKNIAWHSPRNQEVSVFGCALKEAQQKNLEQDKSEQGGKRSSKNCVTNPQLWLMCFL